MRLLSSDLLTLKSPAQRKLYEARRADGLNDLAESCLVLRQSSTRRAPTHPSCAKGRFNIRDCGVAEVRVIPDVKEVGRESESLFLGDAKTLEQ